MAKRKLSELGDYLRRVEVAVTREAASLAAARIVVDLQNKGPAWSGTFRNSWRIVPGDQSVPATIAAPPYKRGDKQPDAIAPTPVKVPPLGFGFRANRGPLGQKPGGVLYTIGNASRHRLIAMDLVPGRIPPRTAPADWYETYVRGGGLRRTVQAAIDEAAADARRTRQQ